MERKFEVPVLLIFFCRDEVLRQVFECVKKVRPTKLYLYQDGARRESDMPGIQACRDIVSQVDWECEVHTFYQDKMYFCSVVSRAYDIRMFVTLKEVILSPTTLKSPQSRLRTA